MLFADNFDYQDMGDFVRGVLESDEVSTTASALPHRPPFFDTDP